MPDSYKMTPGTDTLLYGGQLTEGMKILLEWPVLRDHYGRPDEFFKVTRLDFTTRDLVRFVAVYDDGYMKSMSYSLTYAWIVRLDSIPAGHPYAPKAKTVRAPLDMDPAIRAQWAAALRSGEYPQAQGVLRRLTDNHGKKAGYCCLGVLCEIADGAGIGGGREDANGEFMTYDGSDTSLPESVIEWAGLGSPDPVIAGNELSVWNDRERKTFAEIADMIEGKA